MERSNKFNDASQEVPSFIKVIEGKTFQEYQQKVRQEQMEQKNSLELKQIEKIQSKIVTNISSRSQLYNSIYPQRLRRSVACRRALRMTFHLLLILSMGTLLWIFWGSWSITCIKELNIWLSVYCAIEILHTLIRLT